MPKNRLIKGAYYFTVFVWSVYVYVISILANTKKFFIKSIEYRCDSQFIANTHGCRWGNDCAGDSGWETGNVHAWLQRGDCGFACTGIVQGC